MKLSFHILSSFRELLDEKRDKCFAYRKSCTTVINMFFPPAMNIAKGCGCTSYLVSVLVRWPRKSWQRCTSQNKAKLDALHCCLPNRSLYSRPHKSSQDETSVLQWQGYRCQQRDEIRTNLRDPDVSAVSATLPCHPPRRFHFRTFPDLHAPTA